MRGVAIDLLGESVFVSAVIIGQLSLDVPRRCNGRRVLFYTNVTEVTLYFSRILDSPHDLHVFSAFGAGANIDLERASEQFGPPVVFDFLAVGAAIWAKASAFLGGNDSAAIFRESFAVALRMFCFLVKRERVKSWLLRASLMMPIHHDGLSLFIVGRSASTWLSQNFLVTFAEPLQELIGIALVPLKVLAAGSSF